MAIGCTKGEATLLVALKGDACPNPVLEVGLNALGLPKFEFAEVEFVAPNTD